MNIVEKIKILDIENDGLNIAIDGQFLYIRCKRTILKYRLSDISQIAENTIFNKNGKARAFSLCEEFIFLTDFCDLYVLNKDNLRIVEKMRLGEDLSSDLGVVRFDENKAYINIRNGKMAVVDVQTRVVSIFDISDSSSWEHTVVGNRLFTGTVNGELIETDTTNMQLIRKIELCKKNIYSIIHHNGILYTVSQDMTIKAVCAETLDIICVAKKAVKGMTKILGIHNGLLVIADGGISLWDKETLKLFDRYNFPTGHFNKGAVLHRNVIFGSDFQSIYKCIL